MNKICPKFILVTAGLPNKTKLKNIVLQRKQTILKRLLSWFIGRFNCKKKEETTSTSTILFPCLADLRASKMWKIGLDRRPFLLTIIISFLFEAALTLKSREEAKSTEEAYIGRKLIKNSRYRWLKKYIITIIILHCQSLLIILVSLNYTATSFLKEGKY